MIRKLLVVFVVSGLIALVLSALFAGLYKDKDWKWGEMEGEFRTSEAKDEPAGPTETRDFAWAQSDTLNVLLPFANVVYTQSPTTKLTITGSRSVLDQVVVENGVIRLKDGVSIKGKEFRSFCFGCFSWSFNSSSKKPQARSFAAAAQMTVTLSAPNVSRFEASGSGEIDITGYDQPRLDLHLSGMGKVKIAGRTDTLDADISGSGSADLTALSAETAKIEISGMGSIKAAATESVDIEISGSGDADLSSQPVKTAELEISGMGSIKVAPIESADIRVSGSGDVDLLLAPQRLNSRVTGMGKVNQP